MWSGGGHFIQGDFTTSFNDDEERETQRKQTREKTNQHKDEKIAKSDRSELAQTLFENPEHQSLYTGDLNPNMIKNIWINEVLITQNRTNGEWKKISLRDFLKKYFTEDRLKTQGYGDQKRHTDDYYDKNSKVFKPNDDFSLEGFIKGVNKTERRNPIDPEKIKGWIEDAINGDGYWGEAIRKMLWPKQQKQLFGDPK